MTEDFRIDCKNGDYVTSRHHSNKDSFTIEICQSGKEPFRVFELRVKENHLDCDYFFPERGLVELFATIIEAGGAEELKKFDFRFGEVAKEMDWWTIRHDGKGLSELEKAFLAIVFESDKIYTAFSPADKTMKLVRSHAKNFKKNPPTTVEEAIMFASPSAMCYGKDSFPVMKLLGSGNRKKLLKTVKSRAFFYKVYALALTGEEANAENFSSWVPAPAEELSSVYEAFEFINAFPSNEEFVNYLNTLTLGEIKTIRMSDDFSHRNPSRLTSDIIGLCEGVLSGDKKETISAHLVAVEALTALVRVREAHAAAGVEDVPPPSDIKRRSTVRGGPHLYSELMEIFMISTDRVATLQAIRAYCESSVCGVRTRADMWELVASLLRGNLSSWIKNGTHSDAVVKTLSNEIGGARTIELILHAKDEGTPLTANQWKKVAAESKDLGDAPVSWFLTAL